MIRKLILIFIALSFFSVCFAGSIQDMHKAAIARKNAAVICDSCAGDLKFSWHMEDDDSTPDVTIGDPCGCSNNDTIGAETGSPTFSNAVGQANGGTNALYINASGEYYTFDVTTEDIIVLDDIKLTFDIYIVSYPASGAAYVITSEYDSSNFIYVYLDQATAKLAVWYRGGADSDSLLVTVPTGSWVSCVYQALVGGPAGNDHYLICGAASDEGDGNLTAQGGSPASVVFGDNGSGDAGTYYLDNVKIYPNDRY